MATMRAWRVDELGHPSESLHLRDNVDVPEPGEGQVRITVEAGNINFADILLCQGIYQERPGVPLTPGLETAVASMLSARELASKSAPVSLAWLPFLTGVMQNKHL